MTTTPPTTRPTRRTPHDSADQHPRYAVELRPRAPRHVVADAHADSGPDADVHDAADYHADPDADGHPGPGAVRDDPAG